jgi:hypothetical protein
MQIQRRRGRRSRGYAVAAEPAQNAERVGRWATQD